nr:D-cysteine desulfhydrase family protein [Anaerolineae bacterium]
MSRKKLDSLPRVSLAQLPTPIEFLPNLSNYFGGPEIYIKRDDQTGLATGGNKTRKLEYLMASALESGADCVITAGSTQSNHARQTAAAARKCGVEPHLVLFSPGAKAPEKQRGNVLIDRLLGAHIHWTDECSPYTEKLTEVEEALHQAGKKPYLIPYGGSNATGIMGFVSAMLEAAEQIEGIGRMETHVFATSSGGTQAGMLLGAELVGKTGKADLVGISVDKKEDSLRERVAQLASEGAELLEMDWAPDPASIIINDSYLGGGYAVVSNLERDAIRLLAEKEGILVDPVYTGRALGGLLDMVRHGTFKMSERILFWHTGGTAALFAFEEALQ